MPVCITLNIIPINSSLRVAPSSIHELERQRIYWNFNIFWGMVQLEIRKKYFFPVTVRNILRTSMKNSEENSPAAPQDADRAQLLAAHRNWKRRQQNTPLTDISENPPDQQKPDQSGKKATGVDFFQLDRRDADFRYEDLRDANFQEAYLPGADFEGANLRGADFQGANLRGARFQQAQLAWANFSLADLIWANFRQADLQGTQFREATLRGATFLQANIRAGDFHSADCSWTDFQEATLGEAEFHQAMLTGANFKDADILTTNFSEARGRQEAPRSEDSPPSSNPLFS